MRQTWAALILVAATLMPPAAQAQSGPFAALFERYGVPIHQNYNLNQHVHPSWLRPPISAEVKQIDARLIPAMRRVLEQFFSTYSSKVLSRNLTGVYVAKTLMFYGQRFAGTNSRRQIFVTNDNYPEPYVLGILHAEFSSILMRNHRFPKTDWAAINPPSFQYSGAVTEALASRDPNARDEAMLDQGFLSRYGQSNLENDFNQFAVWLFTRKDWLDQLASEHPRIKAKRDLAIRFYQSIDERMQF